MKYKLKLLLYKLSYLRYNLSYFHRDIFPSFFSIFYVPYLLLFATIFTKSLIIEPICDIVEFISAFFMSCLFIILYFDYTFGLFLPLCVVGYNHSIMRATFKKNDHDIEYYKFGKKHRVFGPAVITLEPTGLSKGWYINGKLHRLDGPAIEFAYMNPQYFLHGELYSKEDYYKELYKMGLISEKELFIILI